MNKFKLLVTTFLILSLSTLASGHEIYTFVGISDKTVSPNVGVITLNTVCGIKFKDSRMCTSQDITLTNEMPQSLPSSFNAWVQPIFAGSIVDSSGKIRVVEKYSGNVGIRGGLNCGHWASSVDHFDGLVVIVSGSSSNPKKGVLGTRNCINPTYVACCAPKK